MEYQSEPLTDQHDVAAFCCGVADLDEWLRKFAHHAGVTNTARVFVWVEAGRVLGYYTLSGHRLTSEEVPRRVGRGSPNQIPAVLIGKLALDRSLHGRSLGGELLVDALERIVEAVKIVAARLVVVDATGEQAVGFYEHFGFVRTAPDSFRLVQKVSDIEKALENGS